MNDPDFMRANPVALWMKLKRVEATNAELVEALNDLLNDCINFDGGKLTEAFQIKAAAAIAKAKEEA